MAASAIAIRHDLRTTTKERIGGRGCAFQQFRPRLSTRWIGGDIYTKVLLHHRAIDPRRGVWWDEGDDQALEHA